MKHKSGSLEEAAQRILLGEAEDNAKLDEAKANISSGQHKFYGEYKEAEVYIWDDKTEQDIKYTIWLFPESGSGLPGGPDWSPEDAEIRKTVDENGRNFKTTPEQDEEAIDLAYDELNKYFNEDNEELKEDDYMSYYPAAFGALRAKMENIAQFMSPVLDMRFTPEQRAALNEMGEKLVEEAMEEGKKELKQY